MKFNTIVMDDICKHMSKEQPDKWFVFVTLNPCAYDFKEGARLCRKMGVIPKRSKELGFDAGGCYLVPFDPVWYWTEFDTEEKSYKYVRKNWWREKPVAFASMWHNGEFYGDNT